MRFHLPPHCMEPTPFSARLLCPAIAIGLPGVSHMHPRRSAACKLCSNPDKSDPTGRGPSLISGEPSVHSYSATFGLQRGLGLIVNGCSVDKLGYRRP